MSTPFEKSLVANANPANAPVKAAVARDRIPMSLPTQKLSVPDMPGWHLHWMSGRPDRIAQALRGGYTFVAPEDVELGRIGVADQHSEQGSSDLGSRVSVVAGGTEAGTSAAARLYLMKLPEELWLQDQAGLAERNESIAAAIRGDGLTDPSGDNAKRYIPKDAANRTIFHPKRSG